MDVMSDRTEEFRHFQAEEMKAQTRQLARIANAAETIRTILIVFLCLTAFGVLAGGLLVYVGSQP